MPLPQGASHQPHDVDPKPGANGQAKQIASVSKGLKVAMPMPMGPADTFGHTPPWEIGATQVGRQRGVVHFRKE